MSMINGRMRIGFYMDGGYLAKANTFYEEYHPRRSRISVRGLMDFAAWDVARREGTDERVCDIVEAHYFRGRFPSSTMSKRRLREQHQLDDELVSANVSAHIFEMGYGDREKGVDVDLALTVFENARDCGLDAVVLVGGDGDHFPLAPRLRLLGMRFLVLGWHFDYVDRCGERRQTRIAQRLRSNATYTTDMAALIEEAAMLPRARANRLFALREPSAFPAGDGGRPVPVGAVAGAREAHLAGV